MLNYEDEILREFGKTLHTKVIYFSSLHKLEKGMYLDDGEIRYRDENGVQKLCRTTELNLPGRHNHENVMAAAAMALAYGVPLEVIRKVVCAFKAVEHRIEFVTEKMVSFITMIQRERIRMPQSRAFRRWIARPC